MNLRIALPNGRLITAQLDQHPPDPLGYRVLLQLPSGSYTGLVVGVSNTGTPVKGFFPDTKAVTDLQHLQVVKDTAQHYGLMPWQLLFQLIPSAFIWEEREYLVATETSFLDKLSSEIVDYVRKRGKVTEDYLRKKFSDRQELINLLIKKKILRRVTQWDIPAGDAEYASHLFRLAVPYSKAVELLKKGRAREKALRLLLLIAQRGSVSREELQEEGFSSKDISYLVKKGIITPFPYTEKAPEKPPPPPPPSSPPILLKKVGTSTLVMGSVERLTDRLLRILKEETEAGRSTFVVCLSNEAFQFLYPILKENFGSLVVGLTSRLPPTEFIKSWFSASEGKRIVVGTRVALMVPISHPGAVVIFDDTGSKLVNGVDLRNMVYQLALLYGADFYYFTPAPDLTSYRHVYEGRWRWENLGYSATVRIFRREPNQIVTPSLMKEVSCDGEHLFLVHKEGFSYAYCPRCDFLLSCPRCDSFLTLSVERNQLFCTRCGFRASGNLCIHCGTPLQYQGFGVEKAIEYLGSDCLLDTFPSSLQLRERVVILNADNILSVPMFNAGERFYRYLHRARAVAKKELLLQTLLPDSLVEEYLREDFLERELIRRKEENLPPFRRGIWAVFQQEEKYIRSKLGDVPIRKKGKLYEVFLLVNKENFPSVMKQIRSLNPIFLEVL
ncbi:Primosomal protein N' (replication factor Y) - superfamily II helicase-like protein [Thermocrinis albus DSM 14484]|uniref:Primosomal protein N' (Replication factor Y)-superfamily II helicase-like protein n=1 Tax=Thermocrinis albus (strain DSM 14484 / JCM 11386 / HI 11/12) TaxID=638303 RepID=D3SNL7_THEAH|nr:primosomal protein N' [Thermocrinis albus]ADC88754.1 Primosomal protein N' (replication factor Y) - superfamily II helicase-like protein [Thermocrinis albus DSM 14484]